MSIVHQVGLEGEAAFRCAQGGCRRCLNSLMERHKGLVQAVLRRQYRGDVPYDDLLQEGRIALWKAILGFDPGRGVTFSTYAWIAIQRRIWRAVREGNSTPPSEVIRPRSMESPAEATSLWMQEEIGLAIREAVAKLPERLRQVIIAVYGLDGEEPRTMAALGREWGVSKEWIRHLRNDALLLLRLPPFSAKLRRLCEQESKESYRRTQQLNRKWLRQRRGRK